MSHKACICYISWGRIEYTKKSIASILENTNREDFDLIWWDNGSDKEMTEWIKQICIENNFYYIFFKKNEGLTKAMNNQMKIMSKIFNYDVFCHIANDIICPPNWLNGVFEAIKSKKVGVVGLNLEFTDFEKVMVDGVELEKIRPDGNICGAHYCIPRWIYELLGGFRDVHGGYGQQDANHSLQVKSLPMDVWLYYLPLDKYRGEDLGGTGKTYDDYQKQIEQRLRWSGSDPTGGRNYRELLKSYRRKYDNKQITSEQLIDLLREKECMGIDMSQLAETNLPMEFLG